MTILIQQNMILLQKSNIKVLLAHCGKNPWLELKFKERARGRNLLTSIIRHTVYYSTKLHHLHIFRKNDFLNENVTRI